VQAQYSTTGVRALGFLIYQDGYYWETSLGGGSFSCSETAGSGYIFTDCQCNTTATKFATDFNAIYPKKDTLPLPPGFPAHPDFGAPFNVGLFVGRIVGDQYPTAPLSYFGLDLPAGSEVVFNYV
jgi:hypothetical protein